VEVVPHTDSRGSNWDGMHAGEGPSLELRSLGMRCGGQLGMSLRENENKLHMEMTPHRYLETQKRMNWRLNAAAYCDTDAGMVKGWRPVGGDPHSSHRAGHHYLTKTPASMFAYSAEEVGQADPLNSTTERVQVAPKLVVDEDDTGTRHCKQNHTAKALLPFPR
jgi:hypothetical protein